MPSYTEPETIARPPDTLPAVEPADTPLEMLSPTLDLHPGYNIEYAARHSWNERRSWTVRHIYYENDDTVCDDEAIVYADLKHIGLHPWDTQGEWSWSVWLGRKAARTADEYMRMVWAWIEDEPRRVAEAAERAKKANA